MVPAAVVTITVSVAAVVPAMLTDFEDIAQVAGLDGLLVLVTTQLRLTAPVKPPDGVRVMVEVLPLVAPAVTVMLPLLLSAMDGVDDAGIMVAVRLVPVVPVVAFEPLIVTA